MKNYKITGFIMPKNKEARGWQELGEDLGIQVTDNIDPYEIINENFKAVANYWIYTIDEIKEEE